jgi:rhodanese-related sulfurtransferase
MSAPEEIDAATLQRLLAEGKAVLVDVREPEEFTDGHIPGARLVPLSAFDPPRVAEAASGQAVVLYCLSGRRSARAAEALAACHDRVLTLKDGINGWTGAGFPAGEDGRD